MFPLLPGAEEQVRQTKQPTPIIINKSLLQILFETWVLKLDWWDFLTPPLFTDVHAVMQGANQTDHDQVAS